MIALLSLREHYLGTVKAGFTLAHFYDFFSRANYLSHLLPGVPWLTRYAAIGYFLSWVAVLPVNAIILADLIQTNLGPLGIALPGIGLKVGFVLLPFIVAFSGSRALSTLHLVFLLPAVGLLLAFCLQGSGWLLTTGLVQGWAEPPVSVGFSLQGWAKWYLSGTYAFYACETVLPLLPRHFPANLQFADNLAMVFTPIRQQNNLGSQCNLLRRMGAIDQLRQLISFLWL